MSVYTVGAASRHVMSLLATSSMKYDEIESAITGKFSLCPKNAARSVLQGIARETKTGEALVEKIGMYNKGHSMAGIYALTSHGAEYWNSRDSIALKTAKQARRDSENSKSSAIAAFFAGRNRMYGGSNA